MRVSVFITVALSLGSQSGCSPTQAQLGRPAGSTRVATYNIQWFSEDANPGRIKNLKSVVSQIRPDVIALQEIESRKSLTQLFGNEWSIGIPDDTDERQELAIAVRRPYALVSSELLFEGPVFEHAFPGGRDVLRCVVQTPQGKALIVYVVHMKSRSGGRKSTDARREAACGLLAGYLRGRSDETNVIVLGDFNDAPDDTSVRILQTGDLTAPSEEASRPLLINLCSPLWDNDTVTEGLVDLYRGQALQPRVTGAKSDNARLRGQDYRFPQDARVPQTLFDQILVSPSLKKATAKVYSGLDALRGSKGKTSKSDVSVEYTEKGDLASDHLPVYADVFVP